MLTHKALKTQELFMKDHYYKNSNGIWTSKMQVGPYFSNGELVQPSNGTLQKTKIFSRKSGRKKSLAFLLKISYLFICMISRLSCSSMLCCAHRGATTAGNTEQHPERGDHPPQARTPSASWGHPDRYIANTVSLFFLLFHWWKLHDVFLDMFLTYKSLWTLKARWIDLGLASVT